MILAGVIGCFSQVNDEAVVVKADASACELNSLHFDAIRNAAAENNARVTVVFRAAKGETDDVNLRRLAHVRTFLERSKGWKSLDAVYGRSVGTDDAARIDFYVGGKLLLVTLARKNMTPCLDCCGIGAESPQNLVRRKKGKN